MHCLHRGIRVGRRSVARRIRASADVAGSFLGAAIGCGGLAQSSGTDEGDSGPVVARPRASLAGQLPSRRQQGRNGLGAAPLEGRPARVSPESVAVLRHRAGRAQHGHDGGGQRPLQPAHAPAAGAHRGSRRHGLAWPLGSPTVSIAVMLPRTHGPQVARARARTDLAWQGLREIRPSSPRRRMPLKLATGRQRRVTRRELLLRPLSHSHRVATGGRTTVTAHGACAMTRRATEPSSQRSKIECPWWPTTMWSMRCCSA